MLGLTGHSRLHSTVQDGSGEVVGREGRRGWSTMPIKHSKQRHVLGLITTERVPAHHHIARKATNKSNKVHKYTPKQRAWCPKSDNAMHLQHGCTQQAHQAWYTQCGTMR